MTISGMKKTQLKALPRASFVWGEVTGLNKCTRNALGLSSTIKIITQVSCIQHLVLLFGL